MSSRMLGFRQLSMYTDIVPATKMCASVDIPPVPTLTIATEEDIRDQQGMGRSIRFTPRRHAHLGSSALKHQDLPLRQRSFCPLPVR